MSNKYFVYKTDPLEHLIHRPDQCICRLLMFVEKNIIFFFVSLEPDLDTRGKIELRTQEREEANHGEYEALPCSFSTLPLLLLLPLLLPQLQQQSCLNITVGL